MITQVWNLDADPHAEIAGAPIWLDSARFDLVAKAPAESLANGMQIWSDDLQMMLRALLADRFKPETHMKTSRWMYIAWSRSGRK
jgi:uncharacterized protein (TIGR03435 family)